MVFTDDTLQWVDPVWKVTLKYIYSNPANRGAPTFPFVHRVKASLEGFKELQQYLTSGQDWSMNSAGQALGYVGTKSTDIGTKLLADSEYVRVASRKDVREITTLSSLANTLAGRIETDQYENITYLHSRLVSGSLVSGTEEAHTYGLLGTDITHPLIDRSVQNQLNHLTIDGYYYFRTQYLEGTEFPDYDTATTAIFNAKHVLEWYTKPAETETYSNMTVEAKSVVPSRTLIAGSNKVTDLRAGDIVTLSVLGGSEEFTVNYTGASPSALQEITPTKWRVILDQTLSTTLEIQDSNTLQKVTFTLEIKGHS